MPDVQKLCISTIRALVVHQSVKKGEEDFQTFRKMMADLLKEIKERGEPSATDTTIAAHLLRIRDPSTGPNCRTIP